MSSTDTTTRREGSLDVPEGLPKGIDLGRINNRDKAISIYGREYVERMTEHALLGDDAAYRVMLEIKDRSLKQTNWRTFDQALEHGIDSLDDPSPAMVAFFEELDTVPEWVDHDQLYRGAVAFWRAGPLAPMVLAWNSIGVGFSMYSSTRPVLFSGRLKAADQVGTRLTESFRYIVAAYTPGGMGRYEPGFRLTVKVRMIHAAVRYALSRSEDWNWEEWGVPINNLDSMNTQTSQFGVGFVDAIQDTGVKFTAQEEEDILALSRYVGRIIGVVPELLHTSVEDARFKSKFHKLIEQPADDLCREVIHAIMRFSVEHPPGDVELLPGPVAKFMTTERRLKLAFGMLAGWQPKYVMEMSGVEHTPWHYTVPIARPIVRVAHRISRWLPHDDEATAFKSLQNFDAAIRVPDGDKSVELAEPESLAVDVAANKGGVPNPRRAQKREPIAAD